MINGHMKRYRIISRLSATSYLLKMTLRNPKPMERGSELRIMRFRLSISMTNRSIRACL
jgi:hypothetical protein